MFEIITKKEYFILKENNMLVEVLDSFNPKVEIDEDIILDIIYNINEDKMDSILIYYISNCNKKTVIDLICYFIMYLIPTKYINMLIDRLEDNTDMDNLDLTSLIDLAIAYKLDTSIVARLLINKEDIELMYDCILLNINRSDINSILSNICNCTITNYETYLKSIVNKEITDKETIIKLYSELIQSTY